MYKAYNLQNSFTALFYLIKPGIYKCKESARFSSTYTDIGTI